MYHPTTCYQLATAQTTGLHQQAAQERAAQAAIQGHPAPPHHRARFAPGHAVTLLARALTLAGGHRLSPTR